MNVATRHYSNRRGMVHATAATRDGWVAGPLLGPRGSEVRLAIAASLRIERYSGLSTMLSSVIDRTDWIVGGVAVAPRPFPECRNRALADPGAVLVPGG